MATANPAAFIKKLASGRQQTAWSAATHGSPAQIASEAVAMAYVKRKKNKNGNKKWIRMIEGCFNGKLYPRILYPRIGNEL